LKPLSLKKQTIQDLVGNEENGYRVPDFNKTMKMSLKSPVIFTQKPSKKKFWKLSLGNSCSRY
jgi:hypothetical protein